MSDSQSSGIPTLPTSGRNARLRNILKLAAGLLPYAIGFLVWYLVNYLAWSGVQPDSNGMALGITNGCAMTATAVILIVLAVIPATRRVAFGALVAIALNFLISLVLGLTVNAFCLRPFWFPSGSP